VGASSPSFLGWVSGLVLVLAVWTPLREAAEERQLPEFFVGLRRRPRYFEKAKLVWLWMILNSLFRFCIWHKGHPHSVIYVASKS